MADGTTRKKVAILGGGVGSMTAAYWLTQPGGQQYDVTVYQMGWRLGGKGASGRNQADGSMRIEEHGLHIWMGFYANAFKMMRNVYGELNRPAGTPLATWDEAFVGQNVITLLEEYDNKWLPWPAENLVHHGLPGDQTKMPTPHDYLPNIVQRLIDLFEDFLGGHDHATCADEHGEAGTHEKVHAIHSLLEELLDAVQKEIDKIESLHLVTRALIDTIHPLVHGILDVFPSCTGLRRLMLQADFGLSVEKGIITSDLSNKGWTSIDHLEWKDWLSSNGMHPRNIWGSLTRAVYDLVFGYQFGQANEDNANLAAGTITCGVLRMSFDYYGSIFYKMQAGMGDTVFTPLYQVLKNRGVKFKFFHRLRDVIPSADRTNIDALQIGVQATTKSGAEYDPLINVLGLDCWPSQMQYDQLVQGDELRQKNIDLEAYDAPWPDVGELTLSRANGDFDYVVFGLSSGAIPVVASKLVAQKKNWKDHKDNVKVVRTQAFQLWFNKNVAQLGWAPALDGTDHGERAVTGAYVEPLDTWADMSHLIPRETWSVDVQNVSYFCGVLPDAEDLSDVKKNALKYRKECLPGLMPNVVDQNGNFREDWLCVNQPGSGVSPWDTQFFRANTSPTELYVLSVAGSTDYRIDPAHPGYDNLCVVGDWVRNGFALGCVESAVLGGMKGVQRLCDGKNMHIVE